MTENHLEALGNVVADQSDVLILPHNDPDPDAIGAALGLKYLLKEIFKVESQIVYRGHIGRAENKALVQYLDKPLRRVQLSDWATGSKIALVDTQPGAGNNSLPENRTADIVIDHHGIQTGVRTGEFVDIRPELGASSTILTDYLIEAGIDPNEKLATALFYGIKTDTMGLSRHASPSDVRAYFYLQPLLDVNALVQIEYAQVPITYFQSIDHAIHACRIFDDDVVISFLGDLPYPDLCAEIADFFLRLKGIQWVLSIGVFKDELILSIRSRNIKMGAGKLVTTIIGERGTAGGHGMMAAGHIILESGDDPKRIAGEIEKNMLIYLKGIHDVAFKRMI
jgi:nanoRNase/pAp phosphatase (c-di-AMP/oligoRNAs hydrolase)